MLVYISIKMNYYGTSFLVFRYKIEINKNALYLNSLLLSSVMILNISNFGAHHDR